ncbi:MAG: hypothetical protein Q8R17_01230 [bacterium]|nr:hypothetical protein [bacterium]
MRTLSLCLIGTSPLLLHRVARHQEREKITAHGHRGESLEEEAREVMSQDESGNPMVPVSWVSDALRIGCSRIVLEGKQISFCKFQSAVQLPTGLLALKDTDNYTPALEVYASMQHSAPGSRKSIAVVAPIFRDWTLVLPIETNLDDELLMRIFNEAGRAGIGLFHPPKKQFGQFRCVVELRNA